MAITEAALRDLYEEQIRWDDVCAWSRREGRVLTRKQERFGALVLDDRQWSDAPDDAVAVAMLDGVRQLGLRLTPAAARFRARVALVPDLPPMDDDTLMATLDDWLLPHLNGVRSTADWKGFDPLPALRAMLDWDQTRALDRAAPAHFITPLGRKIPIDYDGPAPEITLRLQEMFGQTSHPMVGNTPLRVTLLSPGQKPVQTTQDIPRILGDVLCGCAARYAWALSAPSVAPRTRHRPIPPYAQSPWHVKDDAHHPVIWP